MKSSCILKIYILTFWLGLCPNLHADATLASLTPNANKVEYFAEFYSYEGKLGGPRSTHSFGRFVKTINGKPTEKIDISWLPNSDLGAPIQRMPLFSSVPGKNLTLEETFLLANNKIITNHGKFEINESLFNGAKKRKQLLESGKLPYKFLASANSDEGINCIHALMGAAGDIPTGMRNGVKATEAVISHFIHQNLMIRLTPGDSDTQSLPRSSWSSGRYEKKQEEPPTHEVTQPKSSFLPGLQSLFKRKKP